jgi:hypothetical protein
LWRPNVGEWVHIGLFLQSGRVAPLQLIPSSVALEPVGSCEHSYVDIWDSQGKFGLVNTDGNGSLWAHARISRLLMATLSRGTRLSHPDGDKRPLTKHDGPENLVLILLEHSDLDRRQRLL